MEYEGEILVAARVFARQVEEAIEEYSRGESGDEDDVSSQIIGRLKAILPMIDGKIRWTGGSMGDDSEAVFSGRRLGSRGKGSEESRIGADIVVVVQFDLPGVAVAKGILIQAKCVNAAGECKSERERQRLVGQCESMLSITPSSFVWPYGANSLKAYSAASMHASEGKFADALGAYNYEIFFRDFFICWIGDVRLSSTSRPSLAALVESVDAKFGLFLKATAFDT